MQKKLLGIISEVFEATCQIQIIYSAFVKYLRENKNTIKQYISHL